MSTPDTPKMVLRSDADLLAAIPFLVGFTPTDSLVVLAISGKRLVLTARVDIPPADHVPAAALDAANQVAAQVATHAESAIVVGFGQHDRVAPYMDAVLAAMQLRLVPVRRALRLTGDRMFCHLDDGCMPLSGVPFDPDASTAPAAAVLNGLVALTDRAALVQQLASVQGQQRQAMDEVTRQAIARLRRSVSATDRVGTPPAHAAAGRVAPSVSHRGAAAVQEAFTFAAAGKRLPDPQAAWITVLLAILPVRDYAWERTDDSDSHVKLWTDLTRRARPDLAAAPACLLAYSALLRGNGALADIAVHRALEADPGYSMARILLHAVRSGVPPHVFRNAVTVAGTDASPSGGQDRLDQPTTDDTGEPDVCAD
ncbi:DUF4192 domain-containing protein [Dactylosporangium sp. NPDC049525]|uniref:DUF4192 domain-containing protein n=1 Tax=Dactylosporangium sp. NPDC049525 TaxID=3154730 RepID=UPI003417FE08